MKRLTLSQLQQILDTFTGIYNEQRPHRSLPGWSTPATAYAGRPEASPGDRTADTHDRVRTGNTGLVNYLRRTIHHCFTGFTCIRVWEFTRRFNSATCCAFSAKRGFHP